MCVKNFWEGGTGERSSRSSSVLLDKYILQSNLCLEVEGEFRVVNALFLLWEGECSILNLLHQCINLWVVYAVHDQGYFPSWVSLLWGRVTGNDGAAKWATRVLAFPGRHRERFRGGRVQDRGRHDG